MTNLIGVADGVKGIVNEDEPQDLGQISISNDTSAIADEGTSKYQKLPKIKKT